MSLFADTAKITVFGGHGGKGCASFEPRGGRKKSPSGGDGGIGGKVVLQAERNIATLLDFYYERHFRAEAGGHGGSNKKQGKVGKDLTVKIPAGTVVFDALTGLRLRDLKTPGERVVVAQGGTGGRGNAGGKIATDGEAGEARELILELRLIADCGIIGLPNAGKSTLLSKLTSAHPKIAEYPFTTQTPQLGVLTDKKKSLSLVMADIPGLIEGAHEGRGLGDKFLRHIERTSFLLHLVDMSGTEGRSPWQDYETVHQELASYGHGLSQKQELLVANKMDLKVSEANLLQFKKKIRKEILPISALSGTGLKALTGAILKFYEKKNSWKD